MKILFGIRVFTLVKNLVCKECEKAFSTFLYFVQHQRIHIVKNPINVKNVGKISVGAQVSFSIRESTQVKNPMNVMSVGGPSV